MDFASPVFFFLRGYASALSHLIGELVGTLLHVRQLVAHVRIICHGCWVWGVESVSNGEEKILKGIRERAERKTKLHGEQVTV